IVVAHDGLLFFDNAPDSEMACRRISRLGVMRSRSVAATIMRRAQMRVLSKRLVARTSYYLSDAGILAQGLVLMSSLGHFRPTRPILGTAEMLQAFKADLRQLCSPGGPRSDKATTPKNQNAMRACS